MDLDSIIAAVLMAAFTLGVLWMCVVVIRDVLK